MATAQAMSALQRANEVRLAKAAIRAEVKDGELALRDVLTDVPACIEKVALEELLTWLPKHGLTKARKVMRTCGIYIAPTARVGALSLSTRLAVIERVERGH